MGHRGSDQQRRYCRVDGDREHLFCHDHHDERRNFCGCDIDQWRCPGGDDRGATKILAANAAFAINAVSGSTGVIAVANNNTLTLDAADGSNIDVSESVPGALNQLGLTPTFGTVTLTTASSTDPSGIVVAGSSPGNAGLKAGTYRSVDSGGTAPVPVALAGAAANVTTVATASHTISYIDAQIAKCNDIAAYLGATQNVLTAICSNLSDSSVNLSEAQARLQDTDYASATAALARGKILQSAGIAMLSQANAMPKMVMQLLRN
jgi:flagellin